MKVLVTGAYGQLGSELNDLSGSFQSVDFIFTDIDSLNITDELSVNSFFEVHQPDFVINCAAYTAVDNAENDIDKAIEINTKAPGILAGACKKIDAKLFHISTDYVFDGTGSTPFVEEDVVNPLGVYGKTKYDGELNCFRNNPETIIIRTSWLYSIFGTNFVKTMLKLGRENDSIKVVDDQLGCPTYAKDLAYLILKIIEDSKKSNTSFVPGLFHFSNEGSCSWYEFSLKIHELAGISCKVIPVASAEFKTAAKRPMYSVLNKTKIIKTYNLNIPKWEDSLKECIVRINNE